MINVVYSFSLNEVPLLIKRLPVPPRFKALLKAIFTVYNSELKRLDLNQRSLNDEVK